jgi:hypothetical protein
MNLESKYQRKLLFKYLNLVISLWSKVTAGLVSKDMDNATEEKSRIENRQREETAVREKDGLIWSPRFFHLNDKEEYEFKGVQG